jgi:hypothetical protein
MGRPVLVVPADRRGWRPLEHADHPTFTLEVQEATGANTNDRIKEEKKLHAALNLDIDILVVECFLCVILKETTLLPASENKRISTARRLTWRWAKILRRSYGGLTISQRSTSSRSYSF